MGGPHSTENLPARKILITMINGLNEQRQPEDYFHSCIIQLSYAAKTTDAIWPQAFIITLKFNSLIMSLSPCSDMSVYQDLGNTF